MKYSFYPSQIEAKNEALQAPELNESFFVTLTQIHILIMYRS